MKHLLGIADLSRDEIETLLATAEGMHVVEHVLLRHDKGLEPVRFKGLRDAMILEPHSFQVSIFLPGWAPRFDDDEFRVVVERVLRSELPAHVDPCGENGEFHTLVTDMPGFSSPLNLRLADVDRTGRFHFQRYQLL